MCRLMARCCFRFACFGLCCRCQLLCFRLCAVFFVPVDSTALFPACLFRALSQVSVLFFRRCAVFVAPVFSAVLFWWLCFRRFAGIWLSGSRFVRVCGSFGQVFVSGYCNHSGITCRSRPTRCRRAFLVCFELCGGTGRLSSGVMLEVGNDKLAILSKI